MPKLKRTSFQGKLNRVIGLSLVLSLLLMAISFNIIERMHSRDSLVRELKVVSEIIGNRSVAALLFYDTEVAQRNLASAKFLKSVDSVCLYDSNSNLFASYARDLTHACSRQYDISDIEVGQQFRYKETVIDGLLLEREIRDNENLLGLLVLSANDSELISQQVRITSILIAIFLITLVLTYFASRGVIATLVRPLNSLSQTVKNISLKGSIGERAELMSNDEVGDLVDAFNHMLSSIERENEALHQSESRFRILAENAPIGIYLKNEAGVSVYVNEKWIEITGLSKDCDQVAYLDAISEGDINRYENFIRAAQKKSDTSVAEYRFRRSAGGKESVLMEYITPIYANRSFEKNNKASGYIGTLLDVTELKVAQSELEKLAFYDPLTNLPNRRYFRDHLEKELMLAENADYKVAIALVDLDDFKRVNDSLGHDAGDILLSVLADRLKHRLNKNDIVARMGGDEFYVVLKDLHDTGIIESITTRITDSLSQPVRIKNHFVEIAASIGIAIYPDHAVAPEELIRNADIALYKAKENGKNQVAYFTGDMEAVVKEKMHLESRLRQAVFDNELEIYIQPQFDARTNSFGWGEVLLRWEDMDEGFIPPDKFIPVAEETGIINYIDEWVLRSACQILRDNGDALARIGIRGLSVNMSAKQFYSKPMLNTVKRTFADFGVEPSKISFELTESMVIEDVNLAVSAMNDLRSLGCAISLDDFGTGYSSLSYLKRLPIDNLKIDRSFISDIPEDSNDVAITEAIIAMAEKLNISVVAEGIETAEQRDFLIEKKCYRMQGYYFARPMPLAKILADDDTSGVD